MNRSTIPFDRRDTTGDFVREVRRPGIASLLHPGPVPSIRSLTKIHLLVCGIQKNFLDEVSREGNDEIRGDTTEPPFAHVSGESNFLDKSLNRIIELLHCEAKQGGTSGALYTEHLSHALACRIGALTKLYSSSPTRYIPMLPKHVLRRIVDKIHADVCADHTLVGLAAEAGYSRTHFLRAFTATIGISPHQYVITVRLKYARELLKANSLSLAEIAAHCGFANDAHLSRTFHRYYGIQPSAFRRSHHSSEERREEFWAYPSTMA